MKKKLAILGLLTLCFVITGCGIFDRPAKLNNGLYAAHYTSCGPSALQSAISQFKVNNNLYVPYDVHHIPISEYIQKNEKNSSRHILSFIHKDAVEITWPHEMKAICKKHNIKLVEVKLKDITTNDDVYIILAHDKKNFFYYHWYSYPGQDLYYYGDDTVIDKVYRLEQIK